MDRDNFKKLLDKYLTEDISDSEKSELAALINDPEYRWELESLMKDDFESERFAFVTQPGIGDQIQKNILAQIDEPFKKSPPTAKVMNITKWVAAACLLLFLAGGAWFYLKQESETIHPTVQQIANDVAPGKQGAILTLSDGQKIELDSVQGTVSLAGQAQAVNQNRQLVYADTDPNAPVVYNTMSTPYGRTYKLILPDGTKVWLNAGSSIRFPTTFAEARRRVIITGEAYFEVAHNPAKPFEVAVNEWTVEVLGTHFNINAYDDETTYRTTLLVGSVKIISGNKSTLLAPGQQAGISPTSDEITLRNLADPAQATAWKEGYFQFVGADITSVMKQIARWYDVEVEYSGQPVTKIFEGTISRNLSAGSVFKILEATGGANFQIEGGKVIVSP